MAAPPSLRRSRDVWPAAFLAAVCVWTFVSAAVAGGEPLPVVSVVAVSGLSLVLGAVVSRDRPWIVPAIVVGGGSILAVVSRAEILSSRPAQGPFGYANATGGFYLQATVAALMLAVASPRVEGRWIGGIAVPAFAGITVASGSAAGGGLLALPVAGVVLWAMRAGRPAVIGMAALFAVVLFGTIVVGSFAGEQPDRVPGARIFDERRRALWHEAVTSISEHPLTGVGPGEFAENSRLGQMDADARRVHHGFLQFGVETGIPGMGLMVLAFAWLLASLAGRPDPVALTVLGGAGLAVFGIGSCVDYLMHFPAISVTAAALAGAATSQIDA